MKLDKDLCSDCGSCIVMCPVGALKDDGGTVVLDLDRCVECHVCIRADRCPTGALQQDEPAWPRAVRAMFSDPFGKHPSTQHMGRGTEEVKTNDVTNLVTPGMAGIAIEPGRPGVSAAMRDLDTITRTLAPLDVTFAPHTPVTALLVDQTTGALREDILDERVLSAIVECTCPIDKLPAVLEAIREVGPRLDSVASVAVFLAAGPENGAADPAAAAAGGLPTLEYLATLGLQPSIWGKTNVGLGRRAAQ